jgi:hypothetical protein
MNTQTTGNFIVMEMPPQPNCCDFFGAWLLKVVKADRFWFEARMDDAFTANFPETKTLANPRLSPAALAAVTALRPDHDRTFHGYNPNYMFAIDLDFESGGFAMEFTILVQLGFFIVVDGRYQMRVPKTLTLEGVQLAMLKIASTQKQGEKPQPQRLLHTMPKAEAEAMALQLHYTV